MEEPPDHEEKPIAGMEDLYKSTGIPKVERPGMSFSTAVRPHPYKVCDKQLAQKPPCPQCTACGKSFPRWLDLADHVVCCGGDREDDHMVLPEMPFVFCEPCNVPVKSRDYRTHLSFYHRDSGKNSKVDSAKIEPQEAIPLEQNSSDQHAHKPKIIFRTMKIEEIAAVEATTRASKKNKVLQPWEKAAGAQNAEDILLGIEPRRHDEEEMLDTLLERWKNKKKVTARRFFYEGKVPFGPLHHFSCPIRECGVGFLVCNQLKEHMYKVHFGIDPFWCHLCPASYWDLYYLLTHMEGKHNVPKPEPNPAGYFCSECGGHFPKERPYYMHRVRWEKRPHIYCCDVTIRPEDIDRHRNSKVHKLKESFIRQSEKLVPCEECGKEFTLWQHRKQRKGRFTGKLHRHCEPCWLTIHEANWERNQRRWEPRVNTLPATEGEPLVCEDCGMSHSTVITFVDHCQAYKGRPHFRCEPCSEMVTDTKEEHQRTRRHVFNTTKREDLSNPWKCPAAQCEPPSNSNIC